MTHEEASPGTRDNQPCVLGVKNVAQFKLFNMGWRKTSDSKNTLTANVSLAEHAT